MAAIQQTETAVTLPSSGIDSPPPFELRPRCPEDADLVRCLHFLPVDISLLHRLGASPIWIIPIRSELFEGVNASGQARFQIRRIPSSG